MAIKVRFKKLVLWGCACSAVLGFLGQCAFIWAGASHIRAASLQALQRAEDAARDTNQALRLAEAGSFKMCSDDDLVLLKQITYVNIYISDIGRIHDGRIVCTGLWGRNFAGHRLDPPMRTLGGYGIWTNLQIPASRRRSNLISFGNSVAIASPATFDLSETYRDVDLRVTDRSGRYLYAAVSARRASHAETPALSGLALRECSPSMDLCAQASSELHWYPLLRPVELLSLLGAGLLCAAGILVVRQWGQRRDNVVDKLREGIRDGEIATLYQPIVCVRDLRLKGYEVLARWRPGSGAEIAPDVFVPLALQHQLSTALVKAVVGQALEQMREILSADPALVLAINTEVVDIEEDAFILFILEKTSASPELRQQIHLEVTERADICTPRFSRNVEILRRAGFSIWIDDFGTGSANLSHLSYTQFDGLKIDKLFTSTLNTASPLKSVTHNLLRMARELDLQVVIEGIETEEQLEAVRKIAPDIYAQGWLFGRPAEISEIWKRHPEPLAGPALARDWV